jgi:hypothetical protein
MGAVHFYSREDGGESFIAAGSVMGVTYRRTPVRFGHSVGMYGEHAVASDMGSETHGSESPYHVYYRREATAFEQFEYTLQAGSYDETRGGDAVLVGKHGFAVGVPTENRDGSVVTRALTFEPTMGPLVDDISDAEPEHDVAGFGAALAAFEDVLVVGAPRTKLGDTTSAGAAYLFRWDGTRYAFVKALGPPVPRTSARHGCVLGVSVRWAVTAACSDVDELDATLRSAHVYSVD